MATEKDLENSFNNGYYVAKYASDLADHLTLAYGDDERLNAFKKGHDTYTVEQSKEKNITNKENRPSWLNKDRISDARKDSKKLDKEINRDIEPEK
ncbi:MAG: hypothetical protein V4663_14735 [Bacteroidota bacterium]